MNGRVLHILSQRPSLTGSGVTLDALVHLAADDGWEQMALVGSPSDAPKPKVAGLDDAAVATVTFGDGDLDFAIPGMSDVMPYPSSVFSQLSRSQLERYRAAWSTEIEEIIKKFNPDVVHCHHLWIVASLLKDVAPSTPVVNHCHATGLRQMLLCPHIAADVRGALLRNDHFLALHEAQKVSLVDALEIAPERVTVVGAGYRDTLFRYQRPPSATSLGKRMLLYAGKLSRAKGLPWLLDAVELLAQRGEEVELHVAGAGGGSEAESIRRRMADLGELVVAHGQVDQQTLASLMNQSDVFVLPSFYEGLPLVLVEALACGCRVVTTALPIVEQALAQDLGPAMTMIPLPALDGPDEPREEDLPRFVEDLAQGLADAARREPLGDPERALPGVLQRFTWKRVFSRIAPIWRELTLRRP